MKTTFLLLITVIFSCCINSGNTDEGKKNPAEEKITASTVSNPSTAESVSVVWPKTPDRIITVGGDKAEVKGFTSLAIQTAVDAIHRLGGGTVKLLPGNYDVSAPVRLYSNIALFGSGPATVLKKIKGYKSKMAIDAGYGELQITLEDASGFAPGMGIEVYDSKRKGGWDVTTAVITEVENNTIYFDNYLVRDYEAGEEGTVSNGISLISAVEAKNIRIADLTVDGNRAENDALNGCRGGAVYLHKVSDAMIENVTVKNYASDGISWQITENVTVRNCEVTGCSNAGLHPGTGSPRTTIEGNYCHDNDNYGLFVCWRVRNGVVRNNRFVNNGGYGVCTGHMDTDMLFENNIISDNARDGVLFRYEIKANAPHRNIFRNNIVENNGWKNGGYGFTFDNPAEGVVLEGNTIGNSKGDYQKAAIHYTKNGVPVQLVNNKLNNMPSGEMVSDASL